MKKIVCLLTMIFLMTTVSFAGFTDVPAEHWAHPYIIKMQRAGILSGYYDGSFLPSNSISLGEFAAIFTKVFGIAPDTESNYFPSISEDHWAKGSVEAIREYINPYYDSIGEAIGMDKYSSMEGLTSDMKMTREAFIYAMYRVYGYDESNYVEGEEKELFADADKMLFPKVDMLAYKAGLVGGEDYLGKRYMRPERYITRAEASKVFSGLLKYEAKKVENAYEKIDVESALEQFVNELKECDIEAMKGMIYDTAGILQNEKFKVESETLVSFVKDMFKDFSYEVADCGFDSYNRGYLKITFKAKEIPVEEIGTFVLDNMDEEGFQDKLTEYLKEVKTELGSKVEKEEIVYFAKQDNAWKLMLK